MFDPKLGYDPEEWEECPESEHFLVFGFFTRFFLSAGAILFAYYFFKLVEANKNKGPREEEAEEGAPPATNDVLEEASRKLQSTTETRREVYRPPSSADALLQEADQYLKENIQTGRDISPRRFVDTELPRIEERPAVPPHREAEVAWEDVPRKYEDERRQVDEEVQFMHRQIENQMSGLHPVPHMQKPESSPVLSTGRDETWDSVATGSDFVFQPQAPLRRSLELPEGLNQPDLDAYVPTQQQQEVFHRPPLQVDTHIRPSGSPKLSPKMSPQRKLSGEELKALQEWEWELAKLEADRLAKLQDKEVGGEESEFSSSLAHLMPATHISYHTTTQPIGVTDQAVAGEMLQPESREPETTGRPA